MIDTWPWLVAWKSVPSPASRQAPGAPIQKISRPRQIYTGLRDVDYVPIEERTGPEKITNEALRRPVRKRRGA